MVVSDVIFILSLSPVSECFGTRLRSRNSDAAGIGIDVNAKLWRPGHDWLYFSNICLFHIICVYSTYLGVALPYWFLIFVARKAGELRLPGHGQGSRGEGAQADNQNTVFSIKNPIFKSSRLKGIVPRDLSPLIVEIFPSYLVFRSLMHGVRDAVPV